MEGCHDNTHGAVGGHMGSVLTAALNPIFYLHHCNIDRCWRHWQLAHLASGGTADPSPLPSWWSTSWTFFDENGTAATITGEQTEHTPKLDYVYDDEPARVIPPRAISVRPILLNICQRFPRLCERVRITGRKPWPLPVTGRRPTLLPVRLEGPEGSSFVGRQTAIFTKSESRLVVSRGRSSVGGRYASSNCGGSSGGRKR